MRTTDRGGIMHFAGLHHLSPALDEGRAPALSAEPGGRLVRCGWEPFFGSLRARHLAMAYQADDPASVRFVPASGSTGAPEPHGSLAHAVEHAARFWRALFPGKATGAAP